LKAQIDTYGFEASGTNTPAQFQAVMRASYDGWARAIKVADIKLE
jgi:hypothetical protein